MEWVTKMILVRLELENFWRGLRKLAGDSETEREEFLNQTNIFLLLPLVNQPNYISSPKSKKVSFLLERKTFNPKRALVKVLFNEFRLHILSTDRPPGIHTINTYVFFYFSYLYFHICIARTGPNSINAKKWGKGNPN